MKRVPIPDMPKGMDQYYDFYDDDGTFIRSARSEEFLPKKDEKSKE